MSIPNAAAAAAAAANLIAIFMTIRQPSNFYLNVAYDSFQSTFRRTQ